VPKKKIEIKVSDHALVRFLERDLGFSFEHVREKILSSIDLKHIETLGKTVTYPIGNGLQAVIIDGTIVTIR
jgi:hypothetical protein